MPYSARARDGMPVAATVEWDELGGTDRADAFSVGDVEVLVARAKGRLAA